ncbi:MAG: hypothetical protein U0521_05150 [Anaerolineae bacterium]
MAAAVVGRHAPPGLLVDDEAEAAGFAEFAYFDAVIRPKDARQRRGFALGEQQIAIALEVTAVEVLGRARPLLRPRHQHTVVQPVDRVQVVRAHLLHHVVGSHPF